MNRRDFISNLPLLVSPALATCDANQAISLLGMNQRIIHASFSSNPRPHTNYASPLEFETAVHCAYLPKQELPGSGYNHATIAADYERDLIYGILSLSIVLERGEFDVRHIAQFFRSLPSTSVLNNYPDLTPSREDWSRIQSSHGYTPLPTGAPK